MASIENSVWQVRIEKDEQYRRELSTLCKQLRAEAISSIEYFQDKKGVNNERFYVSFVHLYDHLDSGIEPGIDEMTRIFYQYDFDPSLPANGYRSMVQVVQKCCYKILQMTRYISLNRESFLFRGGHHSKELDAYVSTLGQLRACLYYLEQLIHYSPNGELFPNQDALTDEEYERAEDLMTEVEALSQETFYGRCLGFQFCSSMIKPLTSIVLVLASFGDGYDQQSSIMKIASSVLGGGKYFLDPDSRAQQVVNVTRNGDIRFCKAFWSLAENQLMHNLPLIVCPPVSIDKVIILEPVPFDIPLSDDSDVARINPPCAHSGPGPVYTRLLSFEYREGQEIWRNFSAKPSGSNTGKIYPMSPCLVIQIHGGGFVAQSSASHQVYLRHWAKDLHVPLFCFDYSLAPEDPFPRQLEEVFFAYCWALKNCHLLGSTGERICMVGDSAGANLCVAVTLRAISTGIRIPEGILSIYGSMLVKYTPSPSRLLSLMDPLLPIGILSKCLAAYAGMDPMCSMTSTPIAEDTAPGFKSSDATNGNDGISVNFTSEFHADEQDKVKFDLKETKAEYVGLEHKSHDISAEINDAMIESVAPCSNDNDPAGVHTWASTSSTSTANSNHDSDSNPLNVDLATNETNDMESSIAEYSRVPSITSGDSAVMESHTGSSTDTSPVKSQSSPRSPCKMPKHTVSCDSGFLDSAHKVHSHDSLCDKRCRSVTDTPSPEVTDKANQGPMLPSHVQNVADQIKSSAAEFNESYPNDSLGHNPRTNKSGFTLDFSVLRNRKKQPGKLTKSPSSPSFNSLQQKIRMQDKMQVKSPISPSSPYLGSDGILSATTPTYAKIRHFAQSPMQHFKHMPNSRNPFMSPYLAGPELLQQMCPMYFVSSHLDPIMDDTVQFAKKLRDLGNEVYIDMVDDLPHGFLNFVLTSQEAKQASDICVQRLRDILGFTRMSDEDWEIIGAGIENGELDDLLQDVEQVDI